VWQEIGILVGGYGLIVLSYAWVWVIARGMGPYVSAQRVQRPGKADVKGIPGVMAFWTIAWAVMMVMEYCRQG